MNRTLYALSFAVSLTAGAAYAESPDPSGQFAVSVRSGVTRSQVLEELRAAQRAGDVLAAGELGGTLYEQNPRAYPQRAMVAGKTREEVRGETLQAIRDGDIIHGEAGLTRRESFPAEHMARRGSSPAGLAMGVPGAASR